MKKTALCTAALIILSIAAGLRASTDFSIIPNSAALIDLSFFDITGAENQIKEHPQTFLSRNDTVIPAGLAISNTLGYPNGKAIIQPLPHFETGFAFGGGVYKLSRSGDFSKDNPEIPGIGANGAFHFGTGITGKTDLTAKILFNNGIYQYNKTLSRESSKRAYVIDVEKTSLISFGVKGRYNIIEPKTILPYVFSFGGITAGASLDYLYGNISASGSFTDKRDITFNINEDPVTHNTGIQRTANIETQVKGKTSVRWSIVSITPEALVYADFFYFLTMYTGPMISINAGYAHADVKLHGTLQNRTAIRSDGDLIELLPVNTTIATGLLTSSSSFRIPPVIPMWKAGIEFNILALKIQIEGASVLSSPKDSFTAQAGIRVQL